MPIIGSYSVPGPSASLTFTEEFSTLDELLIQLPNNTGNLINAQDIRDSVFTLWNRISNVAVIASQSASASVYFTNPTPVPLTIGGIPAGTTFSNATMIDMWNALLYPYIAPSVSLTGGNTRELGSTNVVTLNWVATKNTNPITSIIVDGTPILGAPFNTSQSGSQGALATQNVTSPFFMSSSDGTSTPSTSTTVNWLNKRYWGKNPTFGAFSLSSQILALSGAGVGTGNVLSSSLSANYNGIDGGGEYLVFAWPTSFGNPSFTVNGLPNTAFTKVNSSFAFTNVWGYVENYDVWMSNTVQNSAISQFVIS
jgi:hypothetical protein